MKNDLVIRCRTHADAASGFGHLMRMLTLADALRKRGVTIQLALGGDEKAFNLAQARGYAPERCGAFDPEEAAATNPPAAIVVDSYLFGPEYLQAWRAMGVPVAIVDDLADRELPADLVINPNITADEYRSIYRRLGGRRLLLGLSYALLRPELFSVRTVEPATPPHALIIFGATDIGRRTAWAVRALAESTEMFALEVVIGPGAPTRAEVEAAVVDTRQTGRPIELVFAPEDLPARMARAALAVSAGGVTATELACIGRPAVLSPVADNQLMAARRWAEANVHRLVRDPSDAAELRAQVSVLMRSPHLRQAMGANGRQLVDSKGAMRAAGEILAWLGREE